MSVLDTVVGVYHFLADRTPRDVPVVEPRPRHKNSYQRDGKAVVAKVRAGQDLCASIEQVVNLLGGLNRVISRGDRVMVKPNYNSPDPPPASTDPLFLRIVVEMLLALGAKVTIGESAGGVWRPTRNVLHRVGVDELANKLGVELIAFEDKPDDWVKVKINGQYLQSVTMPRSAYEADRLVYLPCLKTHYLAGYSGALKLAFGFVSPGERRGFHLSFREEKLAEISLCWQPDIIIMDGRQAFVTGGPNRGKVVAPDILLASGNLVAIDVEAVKVLRSFPAKNKLKANPWQMEQIATAVRYKLGPSVNDYKVIE